MVEKIVIRKLVPQDAPAVAQIHADITQKPDQKYYQRIVLEQAEQKGDASFVAEIDGQAVGYMFGYVLAGGFGMKNSLWIAMMGVDPRHMGQGIGEMLANHIFDYGKRKGIAHVYTSVRWDSPDLLSFFKRLNFEKSNYINLLKRLDED